ncbi:MAG TPA: ABC transporter substrate-binding protein [Acidobacteriota bacterium]|nr:ABC transporter substrate-binding protein [Acidobacteriota bacterium]
MRRFKAWIVLSVILFSLAGCRPAPDAAPKPVAITVSVPYELDSFDPHATVTVSDFAILSHFYEPLVRTDPELKVLPCLAHSWTTPDSRTWIFELEPLARFHSGKPLIAEDVEYSFQRLMTHPELRIRGFLPSIEEVQVLSRTRIQIRTARPVAVFLSKLNFVLIIPKGSTPESLAKKVDGTGPYRINGWKKDEFIRLVRNDDYWGPKPEIQDVLIRLARTPEEAIKDLTRRDSQLVQGNTKSLEQIIKSMPDYEYVTHSSLFVKFLGFDVSRKETPFCSVKPNPFMNPLVRRAIHLALNRGGLISRLSTQADQATQPVPAFVFGFNPSLPRPVFDPERGRALMKQAGLPQGFRVTLHARKILGETADIVQDQLKAIGVQVDIQTMSDQDFIPFINSHKSSFFLTRWGCPTGDASDILDDVYHSANGREFGGNNIGDFKNPEIDRIIEETDVVQTVEERQLMLQKAMKLLMERLPMIPLYTEVDTYALDRRFSWVPRNDSYILVSEISLRKK